MELFTTCLAKYTLDCLEAIADKVVFELAILLGGALLLLLLLICRDDRSLLLLPLMFVYMSPESFLKLERQDIVVSFDLEILDHVGLNTRKGKEFFNTHV